MAGGKESLERLCVIESNDVHVFTSACWDACTKRDHARLHPRARRPTLDVGLPHHLVIKSVKATLHNGQTVSLRVAPSGPHRAHDGLGAGIGKPHFVDLWAKGLDLLHHLGVQGCCEPRQGAALGDLRHHRLVHPRVAVTQDDGAVAQAEIHVVFVVHIGEDTAQGAFDEDGFVVSPIAVILGHPLGHVLMGLLHEGALLHTRSRRVTPAEPMPWGGCRHWRTLTQGWAQHEPHPFFQEFDHMELCGRVTKPLGGFLKESLRQRPHLQGVALMLSNLVDEGEVFHTQSE